MAKPKPDRKSKREPPRQLTRRFWAYSLALYDRPGISAALIRLQDRHGLDVNLLLLCCFAGALGFGALSKAELSQIDRAIGPWRAGVIQPLRALRRALKASPLRALESDGGALRRQVSQAELLGERRAQAMLAHWLAKRGRGTAALPAADIALALERYAGFAGPRLDNSGRADLARLCAMAASD
jgi:uncharacterized protein (TIGR02444 family)